MAPVPQPEEDRDKPSKDQELNQLDDTELPDVVINVQSSDSEDGEEGDDAGYMGYQALTQDFGQDDDSDGSDDDEVIDVTGYTLQGDSELPTDTSDLGNVQMGDSVITQHDRRTGCQSYMQVPDLPRSDRKEILWNQPRHPDMSMEPGHADKIRAAMSGFQLPTMNIPDWARSLPDGQLLDKVANRHGTSQAQEMPVAMETQGEITQTETVSDETLSETAVMPSDSAFVNSVKSDIDVNADAPD